MSAPTRRPATCSKRSTSASRPAGSPGPARAGETNLLAATPHKSRSTRPSPAAGVARSARPRQGDRVAGARAPAVPHPSSRRRRPAGASRAAAPMPAPPPGPSWAACGRGSRTDPPRRPVPAHGRPWAPAARETEGSGALDPSSLPQRLSPPGAATAELRWAARREPQDRRTTSPQCRRDAADQSTGWRPHPAAQAGGRR